MKFGRIFQDMSDYIKQVHFEGFLVIEGGEKIYIQNFELIKIDIIL